LIDYAKEGIGEPISRVLCAYRDFSAFFFLIILLALLYISEQ
jgi:hypothetical protein